MSSALPSKPVLSATAEGDGSTTTKAAWSTYASSMNRPNSPLSWKDNVLYIWSFTLLLLLSFWKGPEIWSMLITRFDPYYLAFFGTFLFPFIMFWAQAGVMAYVDLNDRVFSWARYYKLQQGRRITLHEFLHAAGTVLCNQLFVTLPAGYVFTNLLIARGGSIDYPLPTYSQVFGHIAAYLIAEEIGFYYAHRLFHHPKIYKYIHKKHHEFTSPCGVAAMYAHPLEHLCANLFPVFLGPLIMGSHFLTVWIWFVFATINTINAHCGYAFPGMPSPLMHDFHHFKFTNNFGVLGILDYFHGTDRHYRTFIKSMPQGLKAQSKAL